MNILFYLSVILLAGMLLGKLVGYIKLPEVTGYLIAGVLIGPSVLGIIPADAAANLDVVSEVALGFIAYTIGSQFDLNHIKKVGKGVLLITILEACCATLSVTLVMLFLFKQTLPFSLVLGAIAAATAPAATLMVVRQYKAKGPVVDTLLPVVAMDDAACIMIFGIATTIATTLLSESQTSLVWSLLKPILEIFGAMLLGFILGVVVCFIMKKMSSQEKQLGLSCGFILLAIGLCDKFGLSSLLCCMCIGASIVNVLPNSNRVFTTVDNFTPPIFVVFFTLAGVELNLSILTKVGFIGIGYVVFRVVGKFFGASLGAKLSHAPKTVQQYLGFTLIPQAGVAIGLALIGESILPSPLGTEIRTIVLAATVIYELIGPVATKLALIKAKEI
ncbi:transporter, CPA2 family (TC 2.A.37) [Hathewaya proteolytica DSM 3090]|uniref:Transporter, CPA2 family (TC 2.A.37) n=1 Tax=Hathewaya proteolytica DSM 3090 TaxID=1121331 RepID=A0A1M6R4J2_9CLOT|nr:cation:proton antiporter [Hathewaya proteolytica]SHK27310.1 transporter, CPA2 family (TC 2.A.37) [Hathewaya proteolytica DSM 3090]